MKFYVRRLIRIVPLYFFITTVGFLLAAFSPIKLNTISSSFVDYILSILFIPFQNSLTGTMQPVIGQGWTLNYEMYFYAVFGLTLLWGHAVRILATTSFMVFVLLVIKGLSPEALPIQFYGDGIVLEFVMGLLLGYAVTHLKSRKWINVALVCASVVVLATYAFADGSLWMPRMVFAGIPSTMLLALAIEAEQKGAMREFKLPIAVGDASYSLYLVHGFVLGFMRRGWEKAFGVDGIWNHAFFMISSCALAIAVALVLFRPVEVRSLHFLQKLPLTTRLIGRTVPS